MTDQDFLEKLKAIRVSRSSALKATYDKRTKYAQLRDELRALVPGLTVGVQKPDYGYQGQLGMMQAQVSLGGPRVEEPDFEADFKQANFELNKLCCEYLMDLEKHAD